MSLSVGGLMSGLDTNSIIEQLLAIERRPILTLQQKEADYQLQLSTYANLQSELNNLKTSLEGLDSAEDFARFAPDPADTDFFSVTSDSNAHIGTYNITIHELAKEHKLASNGFGSTEHVGAGTLTIQVGAAAAFTVDVSATDTIQDVADAINATEGGINASVIFDGTDYFLSLSGTQTGEANVIKMTVDDTGDGNHTDAFGLSRLAFEKGVTENLNEFQEASDSRIDIDGVQDIQKDTNVLDDVISGVTITLKKAHDDPINDATTLSIKRDNNTIIAAVEAFISTYNGLIDFYQKNQVYDQDSGTAGPLLGDATANLIRNRLASLIKTPVAGSDVIRTFSDLGIAFDSNGKLELDTTILNEKLNNDPDDTAQFFTQTDAGAEGFALRMVNELKAMLQTSNGILSIRQDGIQKSIEDVQDDIEKVEYRVTASEERMRAQFTALEVLLSQYQATSDYLSQQLVSLQNMNSYIANKK